MTRNEWEVLFIEAINALRQQVFVPYDTGNLKFNAIKGIWTGENRFTIYIDESVAPYVFFTNEVWKKGKNPHEGWIDLMVNFISEFIAKRLGGNIQR